MTKKIYDLAVKTGSYTDRDGNEKGRYENIGAMLEGDKGPFLMLKRTFNPAGINSDRESILVSMFEPKERDGSGQETQRKQTSVGASQDYAAGRDIDDSEIPF